MSSESNSSQGSSQLSKLNLSSKPADEPPKFRSGDSFKGIETTKVARLGKSLAQMREINQELEAISSMEVLRRTRRNLPQATYEAPRSDLAGAIGSHLRQGLKAPEPATKQLDAVSKSMTQQFQSQQALQAMKQQIGQQLKQQLTQKQPLPLLQQKSLQTSFAQPKVRHIVMKHEGIQTEAPLNRAKSAVNIPKIKIPPLPFPQQQPKQEPPKLPSQDIKPKPQESIPKPQENIQPPKAQSRFVVGAQTIERQAPRQAQSAMPHMLQDFYRHNMRGPMAPIGYLDSINQRQQSSHRIIQQTPQYQLYHQQQPHQVSVNQASFVTGRFGTIQQPGRFANVDQAINLLMS